MRLTARKKGLAVQLASIPLILYIAHLKLSCDAGE